MSINFEKIIILFLSFLIIPSLITGPFLPDSFLVIFGLMILYKKEFLKEIVNMEFQKIFLLFTIFYFILIISTILSENPSLSFENSLFYFRYLFFTLSIIYYFTKYKIAIKLIYFSIIFSFIILISDSLYQLINGTNLTGYSKYQGQVNSFFGENKDGVLGSFMARILPVYLSLHYFLNPKQKIFLLIKYFFLFATVVICILSGERAAFIYAIITFLFYLIFIEERLKVKILIVVIVLTSICSSLIYEKQYYERFVLLSKNALNFSSDQIIIFSDIHTQHYKSALKMFIDKPILGHGPKSFRELCSKPIYYSKRSCSTHPHNTYIQLLAETGIIGFILPFLIFLYSTMKLSKFCFYKVFNKSNIKNYKVFALLAIFINLFIFAPTMSFFNNWINVIYYLPISLYLFYTYIEKNYKAELIKS